MNEVMSYINTFRELIGKNNSLGLPPFVLSMDFGWHSKHVIFSSLVHGDEIGTLPPLVDMAQALYEKRLTFGGKVTFILGNIEAAQKNERFIEEDLNRVFCDTAKDSYERRRAIELQPILQNGDVFFDFHQTNMESACPFFTFAFNNNAYLWARLSQGSKVLVTRNPKKKFSANQLCIDEYASQYNIPSITIETGKRGLSELSYQTTASVIKKVLAATDALARGGRTLQNLAHKTNELLFLKQAYIHDFTNPDSFLHEGFINFSEVKKGQLIGKCEHENIIAPNDGFLLFPQYPRRDNNNKAIPPLARELFRLVSPIALKRINKWKTRQLI